MPLDSKATQTTATNSATYLVNKRRRVFGTEISAGTGDCAVFPVACGRGAKSRFMRSRILILATLSGPCRVESRGRLPLHDGEWLRADGHWHRSTTLLARARSVGAKCSHNVCYSIYSTFSLSRCIWAYAGRPQCGRFPRFRPWQGSESF